jgi:hypothetical protein
MRVGLRDDFGLSRCAPGGGPYSLQVALDGDIGGGCGCSPDTTPDPETPVDPGGAVVLTITERGRLFYDGNGIPRFQWTEVFSGPVALFETRRELNDATGQTLAKARVLIAWPDGTPPPKETAVAKDSRGWRWEITSAEPRPGRLQLQLEYLDDAE